MGRGGSARGLALALALLVAVPAGAAAADGDGGTAGTDDHQQVVDLTFPTDPRAAFTESYDDCRSGCERRHKATDLMGEKLWPVYAAVDGTVCWITGLDGDPPGYGYLLSLCGDDGRRYSYVHLNNDTPGTDDGQGGPEWAYAPEMREGLAVERGQFLGYLGDSGNAEDSGAHLHFEIHDPDVVDPYGSDRIDPHPSLVAALERGDVADGTASAPTDPTTRVWGEDRVATAIALARERFDTAPAVVLAPAVTPSEAIVAGPLAMALGGPVLTNGADGPDPRVVDEVARLGAERAVLVGELPDGLDAALTEAGVSTVERVAGEDRFATAAAVAERVWTLTGAGDEHPRRAALALGWNPDPTRVWPDSLMASYYGSARDLPVLLTRPEELPAATVGALAGVDEVVVIGGVVAVAESVETRVGGMVGTVRRLWGRTRYGTATAVAEDLLARELVTDTRAWAATGRNWPDAATSGPIVAGASDVLILVDGQARGADDEAAAFLTAHADPLERGRVIGGRVAVADTAALAFARWLS